MKAGIGSYALEVGELKIGAIVVVNALGDVYDPATGKQVAGMLSEDGRSLSSSEDQMIGLMEKLPPAFTANTTIGVILMNADFNKSDLCKIAGMAQDGMARAIRPVHTSGDGDSLYAVSYGTVKANRDVVGTLAARVTQEAILRAVKNCESAYGLISASDLKP